MVHAPILANSPHTQLAGVWGRRRAAAADLAERFDTAAFERIEALFEVCDAVAFAVPPTVQADLASRAADAGKAVLLEKPIAGSLAEAERLADAVGTAGVASMVVLSWRFAAQVRQFLVDAKELDPFAGRGQFLSGAYLGPPFATPWRLDGGTLLDVGPHVVDLLDAALGPVVGVAAHSTAEGWIGLLLDHEGGHTSEASLCGTVPLNPHRAGVEVFGERGDLVVDCVAAVGPDTFLTVAAEFAEMVTSGRPHPLDVAHGLHLQRLLAMAAVDVDPSRN